MKTLIFLLSLCLLTTSLFSQSRKKIRELGIESITEIKVDYEDSNGKEIMRFVTVYDEQGNVIKEVDYDKTGKLTEIITYEYNEDNDKTKEVRYRPNKKPYKTLTYKYENGLVSERDEYDESNRLVSKKKYIYKYKDN
jgi:S-adenosylmethionine hydrolase